MQVAGMATFVVEVQSSMVLSELRITDLAMMLN